MKLFRLISGTLASLNQPLLAVALGLTLGVGLSVIYVRGKNIEISTVALQNAISQANTVAQEVSTISKSVTEEEIKRVVENIVVKTTVKDIQQGVDAASIAAAAVAPIQEKLTQLQAKLDAVQMNPATVAAFATPEVTTAISALAEIEPASLQENLEKIEQLDAVLAKIENSPAGEGLLEVLQEQSVLLSKQEDVLQSVPDLAVGPNTNSAAIDNLTLSLQSTDTRVESLQKQVQDVIASQLKATSGVDGQDGSTGAQGPPGPVGPPGTVSTAHIVQAIMNSTGSLLTTDRVAEGASLYYTDARAISAVTPLLMSLANSGSVATILQTYSGSLSALQSKANSADQQLSAISGSLLSAQGSLLSLQSDILTLSGSLSFLSSQFMTFQPGGGIPSALQLQITQAAHGFSVGQWVYLNGASYALADADSSSSYDSVGVINTVPTANTFTLVTDGYVTGLSGLTAGSRYYIGSTAGAITATAPTANAKAVLIADTTTSGWVQQYAPNGVVAEYGENLTITDGGTFGNTLADVPGSSFTLPSAGVWNVYWILYGDAGTGNSATTVALYDSSNVIVPNTGAVNNFFNANADGFISGFARVTTTGAATYKLRGDTDAAFNFTVRNNFTSGTANGGNSKIMWTKVAGFLPVAGQTVDYGFFVPTADQAAFASGVSNEDITFANSWTTSSGNMSITSAGVVTLSAGKTYEITAALVANANSGQVTFQIVDSGTNAAIGSSQPVFLSVTVDATNILQSSPVSFIYTPSASQTIKLQKKSANGGSTTLKGVGVISAGAGGRGGSWWSIKQLGTTSATTQLDPQYLQFTGARLYAGTTTSIPGTGTNTQVNVNTVEFSVGNIDTSTANQITINQSGYYRLSGCVRMNTSGTLGIYLMNIFVNGTSNVVVGAGPQTASVGTVGSYGSTVKFLTAGDVVTLGAFQNSGTAQTTVANQQGTFLDVQLLGV